jgi:hypothetical protein
MMQSTWPKRADGTNMTMGEMTPEQQREQVRASVGRLKAEFSPLGVTVEFREELTAEGVQYALPGIAKADNGGLF